MYRFGLVSVLALSFIADDEALAKSRSIPFKASIDVVPIYETPKSGGKFAGELRSKALGNGGFVNKQTPFGEPLFPFPGAPQKGRKSRMRLYTKRGALFANAKGTIKRRSDGKMQLSGSGRIIGGSSHWKCVTGTFKESEVLDTANGNTRNTLKLRGRLKFRRRGCNKKPAGTPR